MRVPNQGQPASRKTIPRCANCGSANVSTSMETDRFTHGDGDDAAELAVVVPVRTCSDCGTQFTDEEAERLRHEAVCQRVGVLTPREVRDIRAQYRMSRAEFANVTRLGEATIARWESGATLPTAAYDQYLRLLRSPENLARLTGAPTRVSERALPSNVLRFQTPRLRIIEVTPELTRAEKAFQLHR